jgi:hypothetical protein
MIRHQMFARARTATLWLLRFRAFALVGVQRPGFFLVHSPSKLLQGIAQRLDTGVAPMRLGLLATFIRYRRGAGQRLQTGCGRIATPIISQLGQQPRGQSFARAGETPHQGAVSRGQKKGFCCKKS